MQPVVRRERHLSSLPRHVANQSHRCNETTYYYQCPGMVIRYVPAGGTGLFQVIAHYLIAIHNIIIHYIVLFMIDFNS
jgi:hypothetical protein